MTNSNEVIKYLAQAQTWHGDQKYGTKPYIYHLSSVVLCANTLYGDSLVISCISAWHDALEDCKEVDEDIIKTTLKTYEEFDTYHINVGVIPALKAITKQKDVSRDEYLLGVKENGLATKVKIADAMCNLRECLKDGNLPRAQYYQNTLDILLGL